MMSDYDEVRLLAHVTVQTVHVSRYASIITIPPLDSGARFISLSDIVVSAIFQATRFLVFFSFFFFIVQRLPTQRLMSFCVDVDSKL